MSSNFIGTIDRYRADRSLPAADGADGRYRAGCYSFSQSDYAFHEPQSDYRLPRLFGLVVDSSSADHTDGYRDRHAMPCGYAADGGQADARHASAIRSDRRNRDEPDSRRKGDEAKFGAAETGSRATHTASELLEHLRWEAICDLWRFGGRHSSALLCCIGIRSVRLRRRYGSSFDSELWSRDRLVDGPAAKRHSDGRSAKRGKRGAKSHRRTGS